jgi:hypothetical protein
MNIETKLVQNTPTDVKLQQELKKVINAEESDCMLS